MNLIGTAAKLAPSLAEAALPWVKSGSHVIAAGIASGVIADNFKAL
jgi:hypothetical protein